MSTVLRHLRRRLHRRHVVVAVLMLGCGYACACESTEDLGHNDAASSANAPDADPDTSLTLPPGPVNIPIVPDAPLAEIQARCSDPAHGPVAPYSDFAGLKKLLNGRWYACDRPDAGAVGDPTQGGTDLFERELGIEVRSDGNWNLLRLASDNTFVAQHGIDNEGTWGEKYQDFTGYYQFTLTNDEIVIEELVFETNPTRLRATNTITTFAVWLVPMGITTAPPTR